MKHVIWSNEDLRLEDFIGQIEEAYPDASEAEKYQLMQEINNDFLDVLKSVSSLNLKKMHKRHMCSRS